MSLIFSNFASLNAWDEPYVAIMNFFFFSIILGWFAHIFFKTFTSTLENKSGPSWWQHHD